MPNATVTISPTQSALAGIAKTTLSPGTPVKSLEPTLRDAYARARAAIERKCLEIGGGTGLPDGPVEHMTEDGFRRRYQNGIIYFQQSTGAHWVHGAILGKYTEFRAESGFLGFPTTDEVETPDKTGRYNHFERGSIYWSPATGAHEVHGEIRNRWQALGWEKSWLGFPLTDEMEFPESGRVSVFQNGAIYWWDDTGARELNDLVVQYTGLYCFGETDADGGPFFFVNDSDEPYTTLGIKAPELEQTFRSKIYDDVDAGEDVFDVIELYRGKPREMILTAVLNEYSGGDTEKSRQAIQWAYDKGTPFVADALSQIPYVGPVLGPAASAAFVLGREEILDQLNSFVESTLGEANRPLGTDTIALNTKELILLATRPQGHDYQYSVPWRFETKLLERFGASYKLYFNVFPA